MTTSAGRENMSAQADESAETRTTGGTKPLHRFLRAQPKSVGIVLLFLGSSMFMFGFPLKNDGDGTSTDLFSCFWLGILYFICGVLYVQAERAPSKKIVTISLALSIIAILGTIFAVIDFIKAMVHMSHLTYMTYYSLPDNIQETENYTTLVSDAKARFMQHYNLEAVFLFHTLVAGVILIIMTVFARMALRSSGTQMVVVMRNLPSAE